MNLRFLVDEPFGWSPVQWAKIRGVREVVRSSVRMCAPPILLISVPRSGSTWVGEVLSLAETAAYLFEPVTQSINLAHGTGGTVTRYFEDWEEDWVLFRSLQFAFEGIPVFSKNVVRNPEQWRIAERQKRCVVIKEVNPFILNAVLKRYCPIVIVLLRHPVAVASSRWRLGWETVDSQQTQIYDTRLLGCHDDIVADLQNASNFWEYEGVRQRLIHRFVLGRLQGYRRFKIVRYEDVCRDPIGKFKEIYEFCNMEFSAKVGYEVERRSRLDGLEEDRFGTNRMSDRMRFEFMRYVSEEDFSSVMQFYRDDFGFYTEGIS